MEGKGKDVLVYDSHMCLVSLCTVIGRVLSLETDFTWLFFSFTFKNLNISWSFSLYLKIVNKYFSIFTA